MKLANHHRNCVPARGKLQEDLKGKQLPFRNVIQRDGGGCVSVGCLCSALGVVSLSRTVSLTVTDLLDLGMQAPLATRARQSRAAVTKPERQRRL